MKHLFSKQLDPDKVREGVRLKSVKKETLNNLENSKKELALSKSLKSFGTAVWHINCNKEPEKLKDCKGDIVHPPDRSHNDRW